MYIQGAIRNAEQAPSYFPGWTPRFYVSRSIDSAVKSKLQDLGSEVVVVDGPEDASAMFWRLRAFADPGAELVMIRDCDSRFSEREKRAVAEWLSSEKIFHIMRDHPSHNVPILGGLWGGYSRPLKHMNELISATPIEGKYGEDQHFLAANVYPIIRENCMVHDSFFLFELTSRTFPSRRKDSEFVGEVFDENELPRLSDRDSLAAGERSFWRYGFLIWRRLFSWTVRRL
jgi:hypothetical protein